MKYFVNLPSGSFNRPGDWARDMEAQGWHGVCASDHFWLGQTRYPHVFVTATRMACATDKISITTSFCNNLFRSPVEFAQACLSLQEASGGRFEAGLGAGWAEEEMRASGMEYPDAATRVSRYVESMKVAASLIKTGQCRFSGNYYEIDITADRAIGPVGDIAIPLVASAGGPRNIREITPLVDRLEIKASARATRGGRIDLSVMATVSEQEIRQNVDRVRKINADIPIGIFLVLGAGDNPGVHALNQALGDGFIGNFTGPAEQVARSLENLASFGIDRVQLTEFVPGTHDALAGLLLN